MVVDLWVYAGLFFTALLAATLLPLQSEALLAGLILTEQYPVGLLVLAASLGNVAGSSINWGLGRSIELFRHKPWFQKKEASLQKAERWYRRYGRWSLLLSWMPVIGDPLTLLAGILREPFWSFLLIVTVAKTLRYCVITLLVMGVLT